MLNENLFIKWNNYYSNFVQKKYIKKYLNLKNKPLNSNNLLLLKEKKKIIDLLYKENRKKIRFNNKILYTNKMKIGNNLASLNRLIFYCEIIGCKNIILDKKKFWFIKNKIILPENNITILVKQNNYKNINYVYNTRILYFSILNIKPEIKIHLLRNEIMKNLIKTKTLKSHLYIHIRSGDIFRKTPNWHYAQPPLCFYQLILNQYKFKKIYLISENNKNPIISKLLNQYSNIIYRKKTLLIDMSSLISAYNIVASISSFLTSIIQLNNNLKLLWDYNIYHMSDKILHNHYDLFKYPNNNFIVYRMEPSFNYKNIMFIWKNNKKQRKLMIKEKCNGFFSIISR